MDFFRFPFSRQPVFAKNMVASSQPLAVQAGISMLERGGNAIDAALACAITLTVVEPTSNGIGGDAFALVWDGKKLHALNASGRSPAKLDLKLFSGMGEVPKFGWLAVTVPGAVSGWVQLSKSFGKLPFADLFEPAIRYAADGFPVGPVTAWFWKKSSPLFKELPGFAETFLPNGRAPKAGELFKCKDQAKTLEAIAESRGESFYHGALAKRIVEFSKGTGGLFCDEDLSCHQSEWTNPLHMEYAGHELVELPPNGQGLAALQFLGILKHLRLETHKPESADWLHLQWEAMKLALADAHRFISDPAFMDIPPSSLLDENYLAERATLVDLKKAGDFRHGKPPKGGTVYLCAADESGMMVSFIQSNYRGFGSGLVVPGTGIALQNRGNGFSLDPKNPNCAGPGKKPFHTIIPAFIFKDGKPLSAFGVMGGHVQAQGHGQMMERICRLGQNPQDAVNAPRWAVLEKFGVELEAGFSPDLINTLKNRGHQPKPAPEYGLGGAQMIWKQEDVWLGASDPRKEGLAAGF